MSDRSLVSFAAHGEYFVSGGTKGVQVWRAEDGLQPTATISVEHVQCVAFSKDGKWIVAGTLWGEVMVWDAKVYSQTSSSWNIDVVVRGVDFSPDSTRLIAWGDRTVTVWDITTRQRVVGPLRHEDDVAAKYSPKGDRIATGTQTSVRVYDSNDGRPLVDIPVQVPTSPHNGGLLWSNKVIFVISDGKIKQIDTSAVSVVPVSEWPVPDTSNYSCISMPKQGEFIAYSANRTVSFWDTSTHTQLGLVHHPRDICSTALSQDGRFLAIGGDDGKIIIKRLSCITKPDIDISGVTLRLWKRDELANAEESLTEAIYTSPDALHHVLASRALIRTRLGRWDEAIVDAKESLAVHPSVLGYIAKSVSLVGRGNKYEAYRACDIAFEHSHSTHVSFLLLVKAVVVCMAGEHTDAIARVDDLIATLDLNSICYVVQARAYMHLLFGNSLMKSGKHEDAIQSFVCARAQLRPHTSRALSAISMISGWKFDDLDITIQQCLCEALYVAGHTNEAGESLLKMVNTIDEEVYIRGPISTWVSDFLQRYLTTTESSASPLLKEWAKLKLTEGLWKDSLVAAVNFMASRFTIYQTICEQLDMLNKIIDATDCFHQLTNELGEGTDRGAEQVEWVVGFKQNLSQKLEYLGDAAMHAQRYDEAISQYSAALSLNPDSPQCLFIKRSKVYVARGLWKDGLKDANKVITLDPSSPWGYERKHAALHKAGRHDDAIGTFEMMLLKISQSTDSNIRDRLCDYVNPAMTKVAIRKVVQDTIRDLPRALIHTPTGRLLEKTAQASLFESLSVYKELISSMTTRIDNAHILREVKQYYRYATFSHTWEDNEPLFDRVIHIVVYDLEESFTHRKLQMFCKIVRDAGIHWAWSDTCCINKADHFVLQEALVAMFKWYEGSAVTIVFLRGVHSSCQRGDLKKSIWNTRGWTFQEYHASKVVRFYTEDWTPYLNLDIANHKDSPEVISEMEATHVPAPLQPGLQYIREKLCLASRRETTFVEDAAYSLLGIFSISFPIVYGEGDQALGRLLAHLLTNSGDTSILAWTGMSGGFSSCLPSSITVFSELPTSHIPRPITDAEMETIASRTRPPSNIKLIRKLYEQLHRLHVPYFAGQRMKLPCITFKLGQVSASWSDSVHVFRAKTSALGTVEIETTEDLSMLDSLILVHPWIDFLLNRHLVGKTTESASHQSSGHLTWPAGACNKAPVFKRKPISHIVSLLKRPLGASDTESLQPPPSGESSTDKLTEALWLTTRLRRPFGALLFARTRQNVEEYRRVASESLITVRVEELTSAVLNNLIEGTRMLDVL